MTWDHSKPALDPDQRQVVGDREPAPVEQDVVIRAEAKDIVLGVGSVMRGAHGADVGTLGVGTISGL